MQTFLFYLVSMMSQFGLTSLVNGIVDKVSYGIPGSISNAIGAIFDTEYDLVQAGGGLQDMMGSFINSNSDLYSGLWGNVENAYNAISIIGGSLLILYFFMGIADKLTKDRLKVIINRLLCRLMPIIRMFLMLLKVELESG